MDTIQSAYPSLPCHGRVACSICHANKTVTFNKTRAESDQNDWRITANPLAWGNPHAEILVLGFSKGPNALRALATRPHDSIPYAGQRTWVRKILARIGVLEKDANIDRLIADRTGRFAWGSLIRCTVERYDFNERKWVGTGGGMLDKFVATPFGREVANNCSSQFLKNLPSETKLVVLFGLGTKQKYVDEARKLLQQARPDRVLRPVKEVAYTDGVVTFVHVEHFASRDRLISDWCGEPNPEEGNAVSARARLGQLAYEAVQMAGIS